MVPLALSLVRPRSWSPVALVGVFVAIPLTLVFILMLNILIATRQYDLVDLRTQEQTTDPREPSPATRNWVPTGPAKLGEPCKFTGYACDGYSGNFGYQQRAD